MWEMTVQPGRSKLLWIGCALAVVVAAAAIASALAWSSREQTEEIARAMTGGDPAHAPELFRRYGCTGCHAISGIPGADGQVGPPLVNLVHRVYIGGVVTNSADHLVQWITRPQSLSPQTAMPPSGISEAEARDIAAYLYSH
jgi:cytochrome c2